MNINIEELLAAVQYLKAQSKGDLISAKIEEKKLFLSVIDNYDNVLEAVIYADGNMAAQIKETKRLMYIKKENK